MFVIRFVWVEYIRITNYVFLVIFVFWLFLNIVFAYSKFFLVLENKNVFQSVWESMKLAVLNPKNTVKLFFLIFILNLRVILNFVVFLLFPILIVSAITYISMQFLLYITLIWVSIVFVIAVLIIWYLTAVLDVFKVSLWYHAYVYWKKNSEK